MKRRQRLLTYATMAQLVEQLIRNQQAAGSSPASSSRTGPDVGFAFGLLFFGRLLYAACLRCVNGGFEPGFI